MRTPSLFFFGSSQRLVLIGIVRSTRCPTPAGEKGVRHLLPERPEGCFAQKVPDPFFAGRHAHCTESGGDRWSNRADRQSSQPPPVLVCGSVAAFFSASALAFFSASAFATSSLAFLSSSSAPLDAA